MQKVLIFIVLIALPFLCGIFSIFGSVNHAIKYITYDKNLIVEGKVVDIKQERSSGKSNNTIYYPIIEFEYDQKEYNIEGVGDSFGSTNVGDIVKVYVDKDQPKNSMHGTWFTLIIPSLFFLIIGILLISIFGVLGYLAIFSAYIRYQVNKDPVKIEAEVVGIDIIARKKSRLRYKVVSNYKDSTGKIHVYKSKKVYENPEANYPPGKKVIVTVARNNYDYYIFEI
jgi:hypothetical protein